MDETTPHDTCHVEENPGEEGFEPFVSLNHAKCEIIIIEHNANKGRKPVGNTKFAGKYFSILGGKIVTEDVTNVSSAPWI